jgi:hypothetical protein
MKFSDDRVLSFFLEKKIVATMRNGKYGMLVGKEIDVEDYSNKPVGKAKIMAVFVNCPKFRKLLRKYSGFETVEEWEETAKALNNGNLPRYIVLLRLIEVYDEMKNEIEEVDEFEIVLNAETEEVSVVE